MKGLTLREKELALTVNRLIFRKKGTDPDREETDLEKEGTDLK